MQIIQESTRKVSFTAFSKLQDQPDELRSALYNSTRIISLIGIPIFIGMALVSPEFVQLFFGEQWFPSIPVMQVLSFNGVLVVAMSFTGSFITALGKPAWNLVLLLISTVARSLAFLMVIQQGIVMIAVVLVLCNYILLPTNLWVLWKLAQVNWLRFLNQIIPSLIASSFMAIAVLGFKYMLTPMLSTQLLFTFSILLGVLVYLIAAWVLLPDIFYKIVSLLRSALPSKA